MAVMPNSVAFFLLCTSALTDMRNEHVPQAQFALCFPSAVLRASVTFTFAAAIAVGCTVL